MPVEDALFVASDAADASSPPAAKPEGTEATLNIFGLTPEQLAAGTVSLVGPAPTPGAVQSELMAGSGPDSLVLKVSQDAWMGSAQYTVAVDGQQIGGIFTADAAHGSATSDTLTLHGTWANGQHTATVSFLNDSWGGTPDTDRNLYVDGMSLNGHPIYDSAASLFNAGNHDVAFVSAPVHVETVNTVGAGPDTLVLQLSQDRFQGDAQYTVSVDGKLVDAVFTAGASHAESAHDLVVLRGDWATGQHVVSVNFLNDAWVPPGSGVGAAEGDRNLYIDSVALNGVKVADGSAALYSAGPHDIGFGSTSGSSSAAPVPSTVVDIGIIPPSPTEATEVVNPTPGPGFDTALLEQFTHDGVVDYGALAASLTGQYDNTGVWFG